MNFLYKESLCGGTNSGPEWGDLDPGWKKERKKRGEEWKGEAERYSREDRKF